ncbi:hypothetical protein K438DRAFT_1931784 [Mycena galopus ATCC 62051]|nr:hypothetical protein K438DRAFT_1931784 [Mycena galopus ATCC 62051]
MTEARGEHFHHQVVSPCFFSQSLRLLTNMCDTSNMLESSALSSTVFPILSNIFPYLGLGLMSTSFIVYALHYCCPSTRLGRLNAMITIVEEMLDHTKANGRRDFLALAEINTRFLRTKLAASRLHTHFLDAHNFPGWKNYVQTMLVVSLSLLALRREVRDVHMSLLVLVEAARQRRLTKDINESQETMDAALHSQDSGRAQRQPHYEV